MTLAYDVDGCINISQLNFLKGKCLLFLTPVRTLAANCTALTITLLQNQKLCTLINYSYMYYNVYMHIMHVHVLWRQQILVFATYIFVWHVIHITHLSTCNNLGFFFMATTFQSLHMGVEKVFTLMTFTILIDALYSLTASPNANVCEEV